ncbi:MAG: DUF1080 domain-containing protein [Verrucomicrobiales bacterium]|nr:DUF1080 domain-containing protein [Verrucomicrobiales bacterium]
MEISHPANGPSRSGLDDGRTLGHALRLRRVGLRLALAIGLAVTQQPTLSSAAEGAGWVSLFDGKTLNGWHQVNGLAKYEVRDGAILGTSVPKSPNSFLCTTRDYADFELEFEVRVHPELNSGVQIRSHSKPDYQDGRVHGYQVEIAIGGYSGGIYDESRRNKFLNTEAQPTPTIRDLLKKDTWNKYRIRCQGDRIQTWVNGVAVTDLRDGMTASGFIGLQVHGVGDRSDPLTVEWRNIRLREIPAK